MAGVFVFRKTPFAVDDELDCHCTAHRVFGGCGDGFVKRIGMQAVAVVVDSDQRLQRGTDVVELDLLRVQTAATGLDVVFKFLRAFVGTVFFFHRHRPNAARHATHHGVFGVHAVAEEERQIGRKVVDVHASRQIGFDKGKAITQGECKLRDGIGACLSNVVPTDRHAIEITHLVVYKIFGNITHHFE